MTKRSFERLSINNVYGSIYTDTVIADYNKGNSLMFASLVMNDTTLKEFTKTIRTSTQIYFGAARKYLTTTGQKYDIIKKKHISSDFNHVVITRKDVIENLNATNDLYDFVIFYKSEEEIVSKLFDKLYKYSAVPMLEEWMPQLSTKLIAHGFMRNLDNFTVHTTEQVKAKRITISKEQLASLVSDMLVRNEISINNTTEKSEVISMVDGLDSYLNIFGDILAERIQNSFVPKYDPSSNEFSKYVNNYDDSCYHNGIELYKAQKATIQAAVNNLNVNDVTFVIGEMGCGKTALGSGISYAHYGRKVGMTNIVMCPSHLVNKWKNEVERLVPNAKGYIVKTVTDLIALESKIKAKVKHEHTYIIMSKESAKISYEMRPAAIWSISKRTFVCPCCGEKLQKSIKLGSGRHAEYQMVDFTETDMMRQMAYNSTCTNKNCKADLWAPLNKEELNPKWIKLGSTGWIMFRHVDEIYDRLASRGKLDKKQTELFTKLSDLKEAIEEGEQFKGMKAPRRYSMAKYIRERYKGYIDYFICDELNFGSAYSDVCIKSV